MTKGWTGELEMGRVQSDILENVDVLMSTVPVSNVYLIMYFGEKDKKFTFRKKLSVVSFSGFGYTCNLQGQIYSGRYEFGLSAYFYNYLFNLSWKIIDESQKLKLYTFFRFLEKKFTFTSKGYFFSWDLFYF